MNHLKTLEKDEMTDRLFQAILSLKDIGECYKFFEDVATVDEVKELSQRLEIARELSQGKTYNSIDAHPSTISRVSKCLNDGRGGYKMVLNRLNNKEI